MWIREGMRDVIRELYHEKERKLYFAGHSLGGALATIAAAHMMFVDGMNIEAIYTMGSPRCPSPPVPWSRLTPERPAFAAVCSHVTRRPPSRAACRLLKPRGSWENLTAAGLLLPCSCLLSTWCDSGTLGVRMTSEGRGSSG